MERKEAIEIVRKLYNESLFMKKDKEAMVTLIPELADSEDERIRKALINVFSTHQGYEVFFGASVEDILAWLEKQGESQDKGEISDGYHTFNELYYYRMLYNAAFFNMLPKGWAHKSKKHHDGEECFGGGWFVVMANLPTGQVSNHYELKDWDLFQIPEKEVADKWDGHTPQEAADRLHEYLLEKQGEQKETDYNEELEKCKANPLYFFDRYVKVKSKEQNPTDKVMTMELFGKIYEEVEDNSSEYACSSCALFEICEVTKPNLPCVRADGSLNRHFILGSAKSNAEEKTDGNGKTSIEKGLAFETPEGMYEIK